MFIHFLSQLMKRFMFIIIMQVIELINGQKMKIRVFLFCLLDLIVMVSLLILMTICIVRCVIFIKLLQNAYTLKYPRGIFVDTNLDLYVADANNNRIQLLLQELDHQQFHFMFQVELF